MNHRQNWHASGKHHKEHHCWFSRGSSPGSKLGRQLEIEEWQYKSVMRGRIYSANHTKVNMSSFTYSSALLGYDVTALCLQVQNRKQLSLRLDYFLMVQGTRGINKGKIKNGSYLQPNRISTTVTLFQSFSHALVKFFIPRKESPASFLKTDGPLRLNSSSDEIKIPRSVEAGLENKE